MKKWILAVTISFAIGFFLSRYLLDVQSVYETGVSDGYRAQRNSVLFTVNSAYQRGWEDCIEAHNIYKKVARK